MRREKRAGVGQRLALDDARLVEQQLGEIAQRRILAGGARARRHLPDQRVLGVDLEHPLRELVELLVLLEEALEAQVHRVLVGDQADRALGQPRRRPHVLDAVAEPRLEDRDQPVELGARDRALAVAAGRRGRLAALDLRQVDLAPGQRAEALALVVRHARQPELVDRVGQQQHLDPLGAAGLELRARAQRLEMLAADRVDRVLAGLHARDVVGERRPSRRSAVLRKRASSSRRSRCSWSS